MHHPLVVPALDPTHRNASEDLCAVIVGVWQVVHERSVLRQVVAARDTIAATVAGHLLDADVIRNWNAGLSECHVDRRAVERSVLPRPLAEASRATSLGRRG